MPRKATAKEKPAPPQEETKRPRRQSAKKDAVTPSAASGEPIRSRRSSTAAQTAASVADATRGTRSSSRSQSNRQNSSDRKSTSRETSLEPADATVRSSGRIIKKINYQESEGEEEEAAPAKNVENIEEEDYNAEDDVENDSDSRESGRNKQKVKVKSPPSRSRGRPARTKATKVETPVKASPGRGRRSKTEKKSVGENEGDFVAPSRRSRYSEKAEEEVGDKNVERVRASSRNTRATRQAATPRTAPQRPTRTSRRQQNLDESKDEDDDDEEEEDEEEEEEEEDDEEVEEPEEKDSDKKDDVDSPPAKKKNDEISSTNEKASSDSSAKKRKSDNDTESKKKRMKVEESEKAMEKVDEEEGESNEGDSEEEDEPMEVDEVDVSKEPKSSSVPSESTDKETIKKPVLESSTKEELQDNEKKPDKDDEEVEKKDAPTDAVEATIKVAQKSEPITSKDVVPDKKLDDLPETKVKPIQTSEVKSVITQVLSSPKHGTGLSLQGAKDQPIAVTPEKKKTETFPGDEKGKTLPVVPEEKKAISVSGGEPVVKPPSNQVPISLSENRTESKGVSEYDAKPKELQPHIVRPMESIRCEGGTFNGCEAPPEKVMLTSHSELPSNLSQPRGPLPSSVVGNAANTGISNSLGTTPANFEKQPEGKLGSNGIHSNQNIGPKPRGRKYVAAGNIKEDEKLAYKDRTFSCVSHNLSGDFMQAEKLLLELKSQLSDIICLQEVSDEIYRSHLKSSFESLGYRLMFNLSFGQKTGLATLYKANLFSLRHHEELILKEIIAKDLDASGSSREEKTAVIEHLKNCGRMLLTHLMFNGRHLMVANVSVPPTDLGAHTLQMSCVARETLNSLEGTTRPLIICGTFNMQENNAAYQLLRDGYLSNDMIELLQSKKDIPVPGRENTALVNLLWKSFQHSAAALNSCYASVMGSELQVHGQSATRPDLMWYSSDCLKVFGILGDVESSEQATSTHLLLKADLAFSI